MAFSKVKKWCTEKTALIFVGIFVLAFLIRLLTYFHPIPLWWDEFIYVGMAKNLFSGGVLGLWENFRPPFIPILLGLGWLVGLPILFWANCLQLLFSLGVIFLVYILGERLQKFAGLFASFIVAFLPVFFSFGDKILTSIPATFFTLLALWFLVKKRWYWSGLFLGVALLTRFLFALASLGVALSFLLVFILEKGYKDRAIFLSYAKKASLLLAGFFTFTLPYFIINIVLFSDPLYPIKAGSIVFNEYNNWLYDLGNWFYVQQIFIQNFLFVIVLLGLVVFVVKKKYTEPGFTSILFSAVLIFAYLAKVIHKETRFLIPVLILLSLFVGLGVAYLLELLAKKKKRLVPYAYGCIAILFLVALLVSFFLPANGGHWNFYKDSLPSEKDDFYHFFAASEKSDPLVIVSTPAFVLYTNKPMVAFGGWEYATTEFAKFKDRADYVAIDVCDHPCEPNSSCVVQRDDFLTFLNTNYETVFANTYARWDESTCNVHIWSLE